MKKSMISALFCALLATTFGSCDVSSSQGCNYYVDAVNGDDANDGLSAGAAWKSLDRVKNLMLKAGDSLLLRRETTFNGVLEISGRGEPGAGIVVDAYGTGGKPCITAPDSAMYALLVRNSEYLTVQNLEIVNKGTERLAGRAGVKVLCQDYGVSRNVRLNALYVHDVNGTLQKHSGEGCGILIENRGKEVVSVYDSLIIEDCVIRRCERNGINWNSYWSRKNWHPSTNVIVRRNLIEEIPGDGIVPIGCDGVLVEYNLMRNCPDILPEKEAAAGMWPWSCDNALFQFNEASNHHAPWDGQGFDSDFNCRNTTFQYNYSHDNDGGFILICNAGKTDPQDNLGNVGTVVQYNISINDGIRPHPTHAGIFSPTIHIGGPCKETRISHNILHVPAKIDQIQDRTLINADSWDGYPDKTDFIENLFYPTEPTSFVLHASTNNHFSGNYYLGKFRMKPEDKTGKTHSAFYDSFLGNDLSGTKSLTSLMKKIEIADGAAHVWIIDEKEIKTFFGKMKDE